MAEQIGLTDMLALLIAVYFIAAGGMLVLRPAAAREMVAELGNQTGLCYLAGILTLAIGGTIVAVHNQWTGLLNGFVSLVGWGALVEGVLLIVFQNRFVKWFDWIDLGDRPARFYGIATVLAGIIVIGAAFA